MRKHEMIRILYDHQIFSLQRYGGVSRYFYELISRFSAMTNVDVSFFQGLHINGYGVERYRDRLRHFWGHRRPAIPKTHYLFRAFNHFLFSRVTRSWKADLYHATYYASLPASSAGKRILTVYDMIHERYPAFTAPRDKAARDKKVAVDRADGIICISESTKRDLMQYLKIPEEKIRVIYLANSLSAVVDLLPIVQRPYLLYVGDRNTYKNFSFFLSVYAKDKRINSRVDLVCFGGGPFTSPERKAIASRGLEDKVSWQSGPDAVLANLYAHAAAFVYPSLYEGFGIPPLEAMHYGCPVLVSDTSSLPEVVGDAGLYFSPTSEDSLLAQLDRILTDSGLRQKLIGRGYVRDQQFSWNTTAEETLQFYREIVG
jgi:glycosyltransferase involved in cell wall biosynthesis